MALKQLYNLKGVDGVAINDCYFRISSIVTHRNPTQAEGLLSKGAGTGNKYVADITLEVMTGKDKAVLEVKKFYLFAYNHTINDNIYKQAYSFLKTLEEFSTSVDAND